ncbi:MAG: hypothetical protein AAGA75_19515 [Cyanobacteria bacterium P01_E01_bin.6]
MKISRPLAEKRTEAERMQDVQLLIEHLARSQETTIKLILDSLYDVGAVNWINQKVHNKPLNRFGKSAASFSKPVFRIIAYRWFTNNCPQLIVKWLHKKVSFGEKPTTLDTLNAQVVDALPAAPLQPQILKKEITQLRTQVRVLTGMLIGAIALFCGAAVWFVYGDGSSVIRLREGQSSTVLELCSSANASECQQ